MRCSCIVIVAALLLVVRSAWAVDFEVTAYAERSEGSVGYGGLLQLTVPLDRFAGAGPAAAVPKREPWAEGAIAEGGVSGGAAGAAWAQVEPPFDAPASSESPPRSPAREAPSGAPQPERRTAPGASAAAGQVPAPSAAPSEQPGGESGVPSRARLTSKFVRALIDVALIADEQTSSRLEGLGRRARHSAWLPELRVRGGRSVDQTLRLTPTIDDPDRWQLTGGADLRLEAQLSWRFARLMFATEELSVERARQSAEQRRSRRVEEVLRWVFQWQSAVARGADPLLEPADALRAQLEELQALLALDVLSAGWFGRNVAR